MNSTLWRHAGATALAGLTVFSSVATASRPANSITVVGEHLQGTSKTGVSESGGISTLVVFRGKAILFSNGGDDSSLAQNLENLQLEPSQIQAVVLPHNRQDQLRALPDVLTAIETPPKVYVPGPVTQEILQRYPTADVVPVTKPTGVLPDAWLVGPMQLEYGGQTIAEQVLVLDRDDGLVVIVGCSHPGIVSVVELVRKVFGYQTIKLIAGSIDLQKTSKKEIREISLRLQQMGVKKIALSRCTGKPALKIFRQEWGDRVVSFDLGDTVKF
jgi:7,8-dihydropterin-6-yl-methyl-4-(beta-D-ribofuranosyl)aminobenzene 5'-phosphate synthase